MKQLIFQGTVFSGKGEGKRFVRLPWVKQQIEEKMRFTPYVGTLNICLTADDLKKRRLLEEAEGILISPQTGFCPGVLFSAVIGGEECAVVLPRIPDYPRDVLEVIAPIYLREQLRVSDGSAVSVAVTI